MQSKQTSHQTTELAVGDIYYILFREKWKIITCFALGVLAAILLFVVKRPQYESEAKLLIRYVMDSKSVSPAGSDSQIKEPDVRGDSIINTEIEILTSFDLVEQVVDAIGVEKIVPKSRTATDRDQVAASVKKNLTVEVPKNSTVIRIVFQNPNPEIVQPVLSQLIEKYLRKHVDIHQAVGVFDEFLKQQTEQLRVQLARTEGELQEARNKAGVISLADTKKVYTDQISKIRQELFDAEAELAAREATLKDMTRVSLRPSAESSNAPPPVAETTMKQLFVYKGVCGRLDLLWKKQQELLTQFTEESVPVREIRRQIAETEMLKRKLEEANPRLMSMSSSQALVASQPVTPSADPSSESARVWVLESKIQVLNSQLDQIRSEAVNAAAGEAAIQELQRKKELEEANYRHFSASLEQAHFDEALGAEKLSNISVIQAPSPPIAAKSRIYKMMAGAIFGGLCIGLAIAFLIELKLDQSVKRPIDIESKLQLPLFLSIPYVGMNGHRRLGQGSGTEPLLLKSGEGEEAASGDKDSSEDSQRPEVKLWKRSPALRQFYEALRDRLITDFEVRNLTHKPKLLAVTSCGTGSGVTTVAVGLAACLSETGDGNVLLVDMTHEKAAAQQFWQGKSVCGLQEALYDANRSQVQENLFVVTERTDGDSRPRNLPKQFAHLVPKLKASDYDYIIFDMPPVSQTSVTPRLAGFMDQVLLVLESEKTDRDLVRQASALLAGSNASVCAVLNKTRTYVPPRLHQGFLGDA